MSGVRELIHEAVIGGVWWKRILCGLTAHELKRTIETHTEEIFQDKKYVSSMRIGQCVKCKAYQYQIYRDSDPIAG